MKPRVVVVDENADIRLILEVRLHRAGFEVMTAASAAQGLAFSERYRPAVALVGLKLPDGDGADLLAQLRARFGIPLALVLAESVEDCEECVSAAQGLTGVDVVTRTEALARGFPDLLARRLPAAEALPPPQPGRGAQRELAA